MVNFISRKAKNILKQINITAKRTKEIKKCSRIFNLSLKKKTLQPNPIKQNIK